MPSRESNLQKADALPAELHRTLLSYAAPYCATPHPTELRLTQLSYAALYIDCFKSPNGGGGGGRGVHNVTTLRNKENPLFEGRYYVTIRLYKQYRYQTDRKNRVQVL